MNEIRDKLTSCKFIDSRPVPSALSSDTDFDATRLHRYRLLLFPVLRLVMALQRTAQKLTNENFLD